MASATALAASFLWPTASFAAATTSTGGAIHLSSPGTGTWGSAGQATTLVLYDTTGNYAFLGTEYALAAGNLATHFGEVTAEPVADYQPGQVNQYTATIYLGSSYNEPIPDAFITDITTTSRPVIWSNDNIWQLSGPEGSSTDLAFESKYGWDPSNSFFTSTSSFNAVQYKGQDLSRYDGSGASPILDPYMTDPSKISILATAQADPSVSSGYTSVPWAIRSANLTYVGEIPFAYVSETDRAMVFSDLLFDALAPTTSTTHRALVRLEDLNTSEDQSQILAAGKLLHSLNVPFSFNVIPQYVDPNGYYTSGRPVSISLPKAKQFISTINALISLGGTPVDEGYTHQYSNIDNPYTGVSGDDFEFYRAQCAPTDSPPFTFANPCPDSDYVIEQGPVPKDSTTWANSRINDAKAEFKQAHLPVPTIYSFPHYAASMVDYQATASQFQAYYDRRLYFSASLTGGSADYSYGHVLGQFFPYLIRDVYGATVIPENLGEYQPNPTNHSPVRLQADIIHEAQLNTVVRDGTASFFYDPMLGTSALQQIVQGIMGAGYSFVSPQNILASP